MKPAVFISSIVVAVLVTVVIEETRIKQMRDEINRLTALPENAISSPDDEDVMEVPSPATSPEDPFDAADNAPEEVAIPGLRNVPDSYPMPEEDQVKIIAMSPYSDLHYALNLTNKERAYFEDLVAARQAKLQDLAGRWVDALPVDRPLIEKEIAEANAANDTRIREFLGNDEDFESFALYHAMQPERQMFEQLRPIMDQTGVSLLLEKEKMLVATMQDARTTTGALDWNSVEAMQAIAVGGATERFETEWENQGLFLKEKLPEFLEENEVNAFMAARDQMKDSILEAIAEAGRAIHGTSE